MSPLIPLGLAFAALGLWLALSLLRESRTRIATRAAYFDAVKPLFERLGRIIMHQGAAGAGQHTKMCNQIVIAGSMIGVCESLLYATRAGLDPQTMLGAISKGAAGCVTRSHSAGSLR